jgi:hypothetical protein|tara:strand:- start:2530 stop:3612 length:1083 start_codon:yes stop_codon:yes gene_type:complete
MSDKKENTSVKAESVEAPSKFEQMLEKLVADDRTGADDLFHEIVVEKSRSIYEDLLEDDIKEIETPEASKDVKTAEAVTSEDKKEDDKAEADEDTKEATKEDDKEEKVEEVAKEDDKKDEVTKETLVDIQPVEQPAPEVATTPTSEIGIGGDATDDMVGDIEVDGDKDNGDEAPSDGEDLEDRVVDLEDAIDELKAEFDAMMSDGGDAEAPADDEAGDDAEGDDDAEGEAEATSELAGKEQEIEQPKVESKTVEAKATATQSPREQMREYVNKVTASNTDGTDNSKSPVNADGGKGATASAPAVSTSTSEEKGGKAPKAGDLSGGNINTPGSKDGSKLKPAKANKADGTDGSAKKSAIGS